jgi:outer membrane lipoprotein-sorting protein
MRRLSSVWILTLFLSILPSTGCLFRTRTVEQQYSKAPLQASTQQELVDALNRQADKVLSLQATVDIDASSGGIKKGKVTDYKEIRGYVLARKPAMLRMIGLMPIVRNKAFDMVSDGKDFKLWIPPKNRFVVGRNEVQSPNATQPLENIRPQIIYDALLIRRVNPDEEIAVLESGYEMLYDPKGRRVVQDDYELVIIRKGEKGWFLSRKVVFSRVDLEPHRQYIFDEQGKLKTDARYADYKDYEGTMFPSKIEIYRPEEEYDITLNMLKLEINKPLQDDQFVLQQPAGAEVVNIDHPSSNAAARQPGGSDR